MQDGNSSSGWSRWEAVLGLGKGVLWVMLFLFEVYADKIINHFANPVQFGRKRQKET
jgi:hypothetical protein